jgi:hypothetical protein
VILSHDYAGDTGEKGYRKCTQSTGVSGKYLVEACGSSLVIEIVGRWDWRWVIVCVFVCA